MKIQKANKTDVKIISDFQQKMALETENFVLEQETVQAGVKAVFDDKSKGQYFVAIQQDIIIGSLLITYEWSDWRNSYVVWIQSVYVLPEYRKLGVFKNMYSFIKQLVADNEIYSGIRLYVDNSNTNAQKVYKKMGMNGNHYKLFESMK